MKSLMRAAVFLVAMWNIIFIYILTVGYLTLGYLPYYGLFEDPFSMGLDILSAILFLIGFVACLSFAPTIVLCIYFAVNKNKYDLKMPTAYLLLLALAIFINLFFPNQALWVYD